MFPVPPALRSRWINGVDSLEKFREEMDQLFGVQAGATAVSLPMALWRDEDHVHIEVEVPGVAESDLEITYHKGRLSIRGERKAPEGVKFAYSTRHFGKFEQVVTLPDDFDGEGIAAEFRNGVVRIKLAPRPESKPRKITFQSAN